jgi:hypothetical protein
MVETLLRLAGRMMPFLTEVVTPGLLLLSGAYLGTCLGYWLLHRFFIVFPSRTLTQTPQDAGLTYSEHRIPLNVRESLYAWWCQASNPAPTFLWFTGNSGSLSKFLPGIQRLVKSGCSVFVFSYRGFAESSRRRPTELRMRQDALAAYHYLHQDLNLAQNQIVLYGQSLGCAIAAWLAGRVQARCLILEGAFPSVGRVAQDQLPFLPLHWLTTERFDTLAALRQVRMPVVLAHSRDDLSIPLRYQQLLQNAVRSPLISHTLTGPHAEGLQSDPEFAGFLRRTIAQWSEP